MVYATRVEALRHLLGQETDTSIYLQELAGLRRGKNQSAKELDFAGQQLSLERLRKSRKGGATRFPNGGGRGSAVEMCQAKVVGPWRWQ